MRYWLAIAVIVIVVPFARCDVGPGNLPPTKSDDPVVLRAIIADKDRQIAELRTDVAKLKATTQPVNSYPSIAGVWLEGDVQVTVTQAQGDWQAICSYTSKSGDIAWEMHGTVTHDGTIKGVLHHTKAPADWAKMQDREAKLSADGNVIAGIAVWSRQKQAFSWTRFDAVQAAADAKRAAAEFDKLPPDIKQAITDHELAVGMTLEQCNKSIGSPGRIQGAAGDNKVYRWCRIQGRDSLGNPQAYQTYTGIISNGVVSSFEKEAPQLFDAGNAAVFSP